MKDLQAGRQFWHPTPHAIPFLPITVIGSEVVLRDVWFGRVWRANAARVVVDSEHLVGLWMPKGSPAKYPVDAVGREVRTPNPEPTLTDRVAGRDALALLKPNGRHSIWLFWSEDGAFEHWYVNFECTLGWNGAGFDMVDHKLDLIVAADATLLWKDEDELEHAASLGLVDPDAVRAEATRVLEQWPFPTGWEDFRPDPAWALPRLPPGWNRV
jgi:hypothetical protein